MMSPIHRLPKKEAQALLKDLKEGDALELPMYYPIRKESHIMSSSNLGDVLAKTYGKHDGVTQGKYRKAQVFIFEFESEHLVAICEKGDRGSGWSWIPKDAKKWAHHRFQPVVLETEPEAYFFARFMCHLLEDSGLGPAPIHIFPPEIQSELAIFLREPLNQAIPASRKTDSPPPKPRI